MGSRDFGEEIAISDLIRDMLDIEGVKSVQFSLPTDDVQLAENEIPKLGSVSMNIVGGVDDEN